MSSDSSSPGSPGSPQGAPCPPEGAHRQLGALQGEMNALFAQKLEEMRSSSPMFSTGKASCSPAPCPLHIRHAWAVCPPLCSALLPCAPAALSALVPAPLPKKPRYSVGGMKGVYVTPLPDPAKPPPGPELPLLEVCWRTVV